MLELAGFVIAALTLAVVGAAVGILLIAPRMTRWLDRDEEPGDGDG